jgi:hypothetical protein
VGTKRKPKKSRLKRIFRDVKKIPRGNVFPAGRNGPVRVFPLSIKINDGDKF